MQDRQPTKPGRIELTDVATGEKKLYDMEMADEPTNPGTPPTKNNLLSDAAEIAIFGSILDKTVNDAFIHLGGKIDLIMSDAAQITLTVVNQNGTPIPDVYLGGVTSEDGDAVKTDSFGKAVAMIPEGTSAITITGYADIKDFSKTFQVTKGESYTETLEVTSRDFVKITTSGNVKFSGLVQSISYQCQGAGGGGTGGAKTNRGYTVAGSGGAGGDVSEVTTKDVIANTAYKVVIGAGGRGGFGYGFDPGGAGGTTTFMEVSASGGAGSTWTSNATVPGTGPTGDGATGGNVWGANMEHRIGAPGGNSKKQIISSYTETTFAAGGGGAGGINADGGLGGSTGGGKGGRGSGGSTSYPGDQGEKGTGGGGGGGSAGTDGETSSFTDGGNGGSGCVAIRMNLTTPLK